MACVIIDFKKIFENIERIDEIMQKHDKLWSLVIKVLGGNSEIIQQIIDYPVVQKMHSVSSSRWQELQMVKQINNQISTILIRPSLGIHAEQIVESSDVTLDSSLVTIQELNDHARRIEKIHNIIIMIEMGDLREGIKRDGLIPFYNSIYDLKNVRIIGIGANIGCMFGDLPTYDKLLQLVIYSQLLEAKFNSQMEIVSGGTSISLPLLDMGEVPKGINHFRIGEAVFLGTSPYYEKQYADLNTDCFIFEANILELYRKESLPEKRARMLYDDTNYEETDLEGSYKALLDFGIVDIDPKYLVPYDSTINFFGTSSDLSVYDLGNNDNGYKTGDVLRFHMKYLGLAQLMNAKYIEKKSNS
jgi:predicted amino acid racemase